MAALVMNSRNDTLTVGAEDGEDDEDDDDDSSSALTCPVCSKKFSSDNAKWQHVSLEHISRGVFPSAAYLTRNSRFLCSKCGFAYSRHWRPCRRSQGQGNCRCGGLMADPAVSSWLNSSMEVIDSNCGDGDSEACAHPHPPLESGISTDTCSRSSSSSQSDIVLNGLFATATLSSSEIDLKVFDAVMNEVMSLPIFTVVHVPKSVRPLLAEVLSQECQLSVSHGAVGFMRLFAFAKSVLRVPSCGGIEEKTS